MATPFFVWALVGSVGIPIAGLYLVSLFLSASNKNAEGTIDIHAFVATSLSMVIIPMVAPGDMTPRYVIPAIPSVVVVALWGFTD